MPTFNISINTDDVLNATSTSTATANVSKNVVSPEAEVKKPVENLETKKIPTLDHSHSNIDYSFYIPEQDPRYIKYGNYKMIEKIIKSGKFYPVYIYGEAGVGKTSTIEQACAAQNKPYFRCQISADVMSEDVIGGYRLVDGNTVWQDGPVLLAMRSGGVLVLDEFDTNSTLMILQGILEGKPFLIKQTGEVVKPAPGFTIFATGNTKGDGNSEKYIGTTVLNDAQLDRFNSFIYQDIPTIDVYEDIIRNKIKVDEIQMSDDQVNLILTFVEKCKNAYKKTGECQFISTRRVQMLLDSFMMHGQNKFALKKAVKDCLSRYREDYAVAMNMIFEACVKDGTSLEDVLAEENKIYTKATVDDVYSNNTMN